MIPTYNQAQFIEQAVCSALAQDYPNLEVIVSDDHSDDTTERILAKFINDSRFIYSRNSINIGRVKNYRKLLYELAHGQWVVNLDGDDYYTSTDFITKAMTILSQCRDMNIVAYCYQHLNISSIQGVCDGIVLGDQLIVSGKEYFLNYHKIGNFTHMNTLYNREVATSVDCFTKPYQASDFESLMKVILCGDIILDSSVIGVWRIHSGNTTIKESRTQQKDIHRTYNDIIFFAQQYFANDALNKWLANMKNRAHREYINSYVLYNKGLSSIFLLLREITFSRSYLRLWYIYLFK